MPGNKNGRRKKRNGESDDSTSDDTDEEELAQLLHNEDSESLRWSSPSDTELELDSDGEEYRPTGRNAQRHLKSKCFLRFTTHDVNATHLIRIKFFCFKNAAVHEAVVTFSQTC